jgi:Holliday junction resolvase-like predicted endonuclease
MKTNKSIFTSWHVGVAAEAIVAGQFARIGYDVSVQYGANQPEYDLIVSRNEQLLKVSVKGSKDGTWGLCQSFITKGKADYHTAIDKWLAKHGNKTIFCFVQFKDCDLNDLPRLYIAWPSEVDTVLKNIAKGRGDTILYENHTWKVQTATGYGTTEKIPDHWMFSEERLNEIFKRLE